MSYMAPYIESDQLVALLRDKTKVPGKDYVIIDVRDKDFYASIQTTDRLIMLASQQTDNQVSIGWQHSRCYQRPRKPNAGSCQ